MAYCWISDEGIGAPQWLCDLASRDKLIDLEWRQPLPLEARLVVLDGSLCSHAFDWLRAGDAELRPRPIIVANVARAADRVGVLRAGADEVLPPDMDSLEARARAERILALYKTLVASHQSITQYGTLHFDHMQQRLWREDIAITVTRREFALLAYLAKADGRPVPKQELHAVIFNLSFDPCTNALAVHIYRLRKKLQQGFITPILHTVEGQGYALVRDHASSGPIGEQNHVRNRVIHA
ncbi:winged helix-turn-helix transcriptional regulator [Alterisphingorhabdus coralli]|uniref:Response regulator transcription factor n=1 Tax=Alterisphingorhabdus coralli TaxID=3071408 RepID=A0AA97F4Y5_9SPHN|nr:response regulator transcription factor [Parasphingorhabdus sp. SCSIO 66989]WOE74379.1 response regulator transcription factor [Parasphingorhabdus sp. SCSIO 66989]